MRRGNEEDNGVVIDCWEVGGLLAVDVVLEGLFGLGCRVGDLRVISVFIKGERYFV